MKLECPVRHWARTAAARAALKFGNRRWSYQQLDSEVSRWTAVLYSKGVRPGSRVALLCGNRPELVFIVHALGRLDAAAVPLNVRLTRAELEPLLERLVPRLAVAEDRWRDLLRECSTIESLAEEAQRLARGPGEPKTGARESGSLLAILFTSGTSGPPKGAELTWGNFLASAKASAENLGGDADQRWLACLPLYHVGGLAMLLRTASYGAQLVLHPRFDPEAVSASIDAEEITHLSLVENALAQTLSARGGKPYPATLRAALIGGGSVSVDLLERARRASMPVLQTYGLTEATSQVTTERLGAADGRTCGLPLHGLKVRVVDGDGLALATGDVGEIEVRGPTVMRGYWADPAATALALNGEWLRTQDLGALDEKGRLTVFARRSDLIVSGGENVYPAEVERAIATHPAIAEVAVVSRDDARWGQVPIAALVLRGVADAPGDLHQWCRAKLAAFKVPRRWLTFEALPRNSTGKVDRVAVRQMVDRALDAESLAQS